jgi:Uma2 family endonuclease
MSNTAEKLMSVAEFLAWEREQPERYEYAGGVVTMMTGASLVHDNEHRFRIATVLTG